MFLKCVAFRCGDLHHGQSIVVLAVLWHDVLQTDLCSFWSLSYVIWIKHLSMFAPFIFPSVTVSLSNEAHPSMSSCQVIEFHQMFIYNYTVDLVMNLNLIVVKFVAILMIIFFLHQMK